MFDADIDAAFVRLTQQWNIAEHRIKKAEFVQANEIVASAIFELRYAGRKLLDANELLLKGGWEADPALKQKIMSFLYDATEDCVKAKHDAIDAIVLFTSRWFLARENSIGIRRLQAYFPDYVKITGSISDVQDRIASSRADRTNSRDATYNEIEETVFSQILALYTRMRDSELRIQTEINRDVKREGWGFWCAVIGLPVAILALTVSLVLEWDKIASSARAIVFQKTYSATPSPLPQTQVKPGMPANARP